MCMAMPCKWGGTRVTPANRSFLTVSHMYRISHQYFAASPWPSPQSIASECNGDPLFLAFYRELTHRHWHAVSRPTLRDRMEGWDVYRELFDELLETAESSEGDNTSTQPPKLFINPDWVFDILNEFVYQFQGFCQFRTTLYASANKHHLLGTGEPNPKAPHHVVENVGVLKNVGDVWNVETVYHYLSRMVQIGTSSKVAPAYQYFGIFASVSLSRLECLLGDYTGCLQAMNPILETEWMVELPKPKLPTDDMTPYEPKTFVEIANSVLLARISLAYHAGIALLMLQRYKDAIAMVSDICSYLQRGFKVGTCPITFTIARHGDGPWDNLMSAVPSITQPFTHSRDPPSEPKRRGNFENYPTRINSSKTTIV